MSNILKHTRNYLLGSIGIKALGFVSIPFFTNYLTVEEYGYMSLYLAILSFFTTLLGFGILGSIKRYYFEEKNDFGSFLFTNLITLLVLDFLVVLGLLVFKNSVADYLEVPANIISLSLFAAFFSLVIKIKLDILQVSENSKYNVIFEFLKTAGALLVSIILILIFSESKYEGKIYGDLIAYGLFAFYSIYSIGKLIKFKFKFKHARYALLFGLPVLPSMFSSYGLNFADRLMINMFQSTEDVGFYSLAFSISMLLQVVILATSKSWQPQFYKSLNEGDNTVLSKVFKVNSEIVFTASLFIIYFSYEMIYILSNENYLEAFDVVIYLVLGFNFFYLYTAFGQYTSFVKKTYFNSLYTFIAVSVNIGLNYYFIPKYGYEASAVTTIVSYALLFLMFYFNARFILKFEVFELKSSSKIFLLYILFIIPFILLQTWEINYFLKFLIKGFSFLIFFYIIFSDQIRTRLKKI